MKVQGYTRKIALAILTVCFAHTLCNGQNIRLYDASSGLSENSIKSIIQDKKGYIWFATQDGLNVFNGSTFKSYGCSYQPTRNGDIGTLNILTILQHHDGEQIWVGLQSATILLFNPETETFRELKLYKESESPPNVCHSIAYDNDNNLWIGTDSGIFVYDEAADSFAHYSSQNSNLPADLIGTIFCDSKGIIWVGSEGGLSKFNPLTNNFINIRVDSRTAPKNDNYHIISITEDPLGILWIGSWNNGLGKLDRNDNSLKYITPRDDVRYPDMLRVRSLVVDTPGTLWMCTNIGLLKYDIMENRLKQVVLSARQPTDNIYSCLKDKEGGMWIGSYFRGAYYISPKARQIECYTLDNIPEYLYGSAISSFCEDDEGKIWVASENGGLSLFDPSNKKFIRTDYHIANDNLHALCIDGNYLYVGAFTKGLRQVDLKTGCVEVFQKERPRSVNNNNIYSLLKGRDGFLYIGTAQGCSRYDTRRGVFSDIEELKKAFIYDIAEDTQGNLWFAGYYDGLYRYDKKNGTWTQYRHDESDENSLPHNKLVSIYLDDKQRLWICSEGGGVCRYDYETDSFRRFDLYNKGEKVYLTVVYGILNDASGNLWLSSNNGIYCCDEEGRNIRHFTHEDGLQSNQYNFGATFRSSTGKLYFGGINGFNVFDPETIEDNSIRPTVTASVSYKNKRNAEYSSRKETGTRTIVIPRNINSFSLDFECLSYVAPGKNEFAYILNKNGHWTYTKGSSVTFIDFPHGKHTIKVRARNGDGNWSVNEAVLHIDNRPPLMKSMAAKTGYVVIVLTVLVLTMLAIERLRKERIRGQIQEIKARQEQEAYKARIEFFTHVAHEIKTPVSLIKAPLEVVMKNQHCEENQRNLDIIEKNTQRLLNLVNQLLDFKKVSNEGYQINMQTTDPVQLVRCMVSRFHGTAAADGIEIEMNLPETPISCMLDTESYVKIVSNLMTNAVKYTKSKIIVSLSLQSSVNCRLLHLSVSDNGEGIVESERAHVFNSFYQINKGNNPRIAGVGLGLSLVKLLTEKHNGCAYVDRNYSDGCSMCIDIPYVEPHSAPESVSPEPAADKEPATAAPMPGGLKVLIVEDSEDMRNFISGVFQEGHTILIVENGMKALAILQKQDVDIIISDLSMPVMDGFELLKAIRKDDMLCHTPFIILTVESSLETKIKGLEYGADAYIEKPFSVEHLHATVHNLISSRESLRKRFISEPLKQENEAIVSSRDHSWLDKITALIHANLNEPEISIDNLAAEMNLSRSSFQRKIKGLTGLTPIEFIRLIRLKKAAELLITATYRINEVCYLVGFNKPSYFSFLFKKQFGILPRDFAQNNGAGLKDHKEDHE